MDLGGKDYSEDEGEDEKVEGFATEAEAEADDARIAANRAAAGGMAEVVSAREAKASEGKTRATAEAERARELEEARRWAHERIPADQLREVARMSARIARREQNEDIESEWRLREVQQAVHELTQKGGQVGRNWNDRMEITLSAAALARMNLHTEAEISNYAATLNRAYTNNVMDIRPILTANLHRDGQGRMYITAITSRTYDEIRNGDRAARGPRSYRGSFKDLYRRERTHKHPFFRDDL